MHDILLLLLSAVATMLLFVFSILIHELGHAAVVALLLGRSAVQEIRAGSLKILHWKRLYVGLLPIWGYVRFDEDRASPSNWRLIFVAGPAASVLTAYFFFGLRYFPLPANWLQVCFIMGMANLALAGLNLLPIPPLDGWKIIESYLPLIGIRLTREGRARLYRWGMIFITTASFAYILLAGVYKG
jgi:Zn-dependent proteases